MVIGHLSCKANLICSVGSLGWSREASGFWTSVRCSSFQPKRNLHADSQNSVETCVTWIELVLKTFIKTLAPDVDAGKCFEPFLNDHLFFLCPFGQAKAPGISFLKNIF